MDTNGKTDHRRRSVKLPEITLADWMEAENSFRATPPQPKNSMTAVQYARQTGRCPSMARIVLNEMLAKGMVTRERWRCSRNNYCWIYFLKKK